MADIKDFKNIVLITSPKTYDRCKKFAAEYEKVKNAFGELNYRVLYSADGVACPPPNWWNQDVNARHRGAGAWWCFLAHYYAIADAVSWNRENLIVFEDDAFFAENAAEKIKAGFDQLPEDWDVLYLGGQHLNTWRAVPRYFSNDLVKGCDVNRNHAYAVSRRGLSKIFSLYQNLLQEQGEAKHQDHVLGEATQRGDLKCFALNPFVVGQSEGKSELVNKDFPNRLWNTNQQEVNLIISPGVLVKYLFVGYGEIGTGGKAGFDNLILPSPSIEEATRFGLHAPATMEIEADRNIKICFHSLETYRSATVQIEIDGKIAYEITGPKFKSDWITLSPGQHSINLITPHGNYYAHTWVEIDCTPIPNLASEPVHKPKRSKKA